MADSIDSDNFDASGAAKALGRLGGLKGGKARANSLTPERRREIAQKAVQTRWAKAKEGKIPTAIHGSPDHPLRIAGFEIPCYVLDDSRRVLIQKGMIDALDMRQGTAAKGEGDRLAKFIATKSVNPFVGKDLADLIIEPILFNTPGGALAYGYEAVVLADLCEAVLKARREGKLNYQQEHIAKRCEILISGFARVGIIALVDEATGYQYYRARKALEDILAEFISKELHKWSKMFPDEFYRELFRLRKWRYDPKSTRRPIHVAKLTVDLIYARLAPGVYEELRRITPRDDKGRLKHKLFQRLTEEVGHPKLQEHFIAVNTLMKAFDDWDQFYRRLDRVFPKFNETPMLPFKEDDKESPDELG